MKYSELKICSAMRYTYVIRLDKTSSYNRVSYLHVGTGTVPKRTGIGIGKIIKIPVSAYMSHILSPSYK